MRKVSVWFACAVLLCSRDARGCAPAPHRGEWVGVAEEAALIVWEPQTRTQHFIRRATFIGEATDFGFLVPTPGVPTLTEVDDGVFDHLRRKTARQTVYRKVSEIDWTPTFFLLIANKAETATAAREPVEVLSTQKVGGYEAAILDATDANALSDWLGKNGYDTSPDLAEWLKAYIDKRWIITAYKIDPPSASAIRTSAVRMTFTTDQPFFPYREPASQREGEAGNEPRVLKIWFVGPERVTGRVASQNWTGQLYWSDAVRDLELGGVKLDPKARLSAFEDHATPRPGVDDLYFERDANQRAVQPPPLVETEIVTTSVPFDLLLAPVLIGGWLFRRSRKRRRQIRD